MSPSPAASLAGPAPEILPHACPAPAPPLQLSGARGWKLLALAYGTLGVVYGDIGTSPLYVFSSGVMMLRLPGLAASIPTCQGLLVSTRTNKRLACRPRRSAAVYPDGAPSDTNQARAGRDTACAGL